MREWLGDRQSRWTEALEELVRCESPSGDAPGIAQCGGIAQRLFKDLDGPPESQSLEEGGVPSLILRWGRSDQRSVLLLAHLDTVWDRGSFAPLFEVQDGRAQGPGVFDMKGGVVIALAALSALQEMASMRGGVTLLLTGDEEVGSSTSKSLIETEARRSAAVLVLEPPVGSAVKIARKGVAGYSVAVHGRAAHAGLDPERGVNSLVAIAPLVAEISSLSRPDAGTTVSPTKLLAGSRTNVIPAEATLHVDVRFTTAAEAGRVEAGIRGLTVAVPEARIQIAGGANRPPFETASSSQLFSIAREVASELGWPELEGASVGGGSDGNFTAALGIPTLDGLGVVGGNAHAKGEWAELESIPDRAALLGGCIARVWQELR
jgi:glutamate carboxypeptidase